MLLLRQRGRPWAGWSRLGDAPTAARRRQHCAPAGARAGLLQRRQRDGRRRVQQLLRHARIPLLRRWRRGLVRGGRAESRPLLLCPAGAQGEGHRGAWGGGHSCCGGGAGRHARRRVAALLAAAGTRRRVRAGFEGGGGQRRGGSAGSLVGRGGSPDGCRLLQMGNRAHHARFRGDPAVAAPAGGSARESARAALGESCAQGGRRRTNKRRTRRQSAAPDPAAPPRRRRRPAEGPRPAASPPRPPWSARRLPHRP